MSPSHLAVEVFCSYAPEDGGYLKQLENHLSALKRQGLISLWHNRQISPGANRTNTIDEHLEAASIILLLISADFISSDYCYTIEMKRALERHSAHQAHVIPIVVRPCDWRQLPIASLQVLPMGAKPISTWKSVDEGWLQVAAGLRSVIEGEAPVHVSYSGLESPPTIKPTRPASYLPFLRNPLFQPRPGEFEELERLLLRTGEAQQPIYVGLVGITGMGGVGKTQLAVEFAYRFQHRFPAGIFWMLATGKSLSDWQRRLAVLAADTEYLPPDDDVSNPENEARRARYFSRYLACHADALLILDNVEDPALVISLLPVLAGGNVVCSILYTSRSLLTPPGTIQYTVKQLPEIGALRLLLETTRPLLLSEILAGSQDVEAHAARYVCQGVGGLPLALVHLRGLLARDQRVTLVRLAEVLKQRGALDLTKIQSGDAASLFATFRLSWEKIQHKGAQRLFQLASYFPESAPIPLWLLGLAAGLGESRDIFEPLGEALLYLHEASLLEELSREQVRLHPLVREFGQRLVTEDGEKGRDVLEETAQQLIHYFTDLNSLEHRALLYGYWKCREQVQAVRAYVEELGTDKTELLVWLEGCLDRESRLLGNEQWWPKEIPALFYQQLFNRSVEEGHPLMGKDAPMFWLRQESRIGGTEDRSLVRVFAGHSSYVNGVAFSPDGTQVLTGSADNTAHLWEMSSGKLLWILKGHTDWVNSVAFSPDGTQVLTGSQDTTARLWETASGKLLRTLKGHTGWVRCVAFSPNGTQVLTGSNDTTARLWGTATGKLLRTLKGHISWIESVAFSPDGTQVLTGSGDDTARLWETATGKTLRILKGHAIWVNSVAFSPDGTQVLTGSHDYTARLWKTTTGKLLRVFVGHTQPIKSVAFSPDGTQVLTSSEDTTARLWETTSGELLRVFAGHTFPVQSVAFSPDGTQVLTGSWDTTARLWVITRGELTTSRENHTSEVNSVAFSPDGTQVLTGSDDTTARLWETASGKLLWILKGHTGKVNSVAFSPDGTQVLTGSDDYTARLWETATGQLLRTLKGHTSWVKCVAFSPDGTQLLTGSSDDTARLWETASGRFLRTLKGHTGWVRSVAFSPDGTQVLTGGGDSIAQLWETATGQLLRTLKGHASYVENIVFSPDGTQALIGSSSGFVAPIHGKVHLWEMTSGELLRTLEDHTNSSNGVAFSPDSHLIIISNLYGRVFFWKTSALETSRLLGVYDAAHRVGAIHWYDKTHVVLADIGGPYSNIHIYQLRLEGRW